jgi:hypothetical protein
MSETAKALVQKMVEAREWPEPALLDEILAQGQEAVEPLLEVVRSRPDGWPAEAPLGSAIVLLCILRPPEAIPALVDLLRAYRNETAETVSDNAAAYDAAIIEPALAVVRDATLAWYSRSAAAELAIRAAGKEPEPRARIAATLRELLQQQLADASRYTGAQGEEEEAEEDPEEAPDNEGEAGEESSWDDEAEEALKELLDEEDAGGEDEEGSPPPGSAEDFFALTTTLVTDLASLADPEARELIRQAFEADVVDTWMIGEEDVAADYREGGRRSDPSDPRAALERYRTDYENHRAEERRKPLELHQDQPAPSPAAFENDYLEPRQQPFVKEDRKPGRNEPCWCGSGKKYKHCHMRQDRQ